jgi:hypothetical protein
MNMSKKPGRPIVPTSASQLTPWKAYGKSRAWYYWRKQYGDLPEPRYPFFDAHDIDLLEPKYPMWDAHDIGVEGREYPF